MRAIIYTRTATVTGHDALARQAVGVTVVTADGAEARGASAG